MAGLLGAALAGLSGYEQGRAKKQQNNQAAAEQAKKDALDQQQMQNTTTYQNAVLANNTSAAAEKKRVDDANMLASGIDPSTGQPLAPLPVPKELSKYGKTPADEAARYTHLAAWAAQNNRPDQAATYQKAADAMALNAERSANANYTNTVKPRIAASQIGLNESHADYYKQLPAILKERIASGAQIAQARLGAQATEAANRIAASASLAGFNANARLAIAQMTLGAQYGQKLPLDAAMKQATTEYTQQMDTYRQQNNPLTDNGKTTGTQPDYSALLAAALAGSNRGGSNVTLDVHIDPSTGALVKGPARLGTTAVSKPPIKNVPPTTNRPSIISEITKLRNAGFDPATSPQARAALKADGFSDAEINAALQSRVQPLPVGPPAIRGVLPQLLGR